ncbi:MAG: glycosyltransferase [Verrucomicrobiota bacterium]|nr:glycosyltransferase [Verrucomicrobiota bacterium]
MEQLTFSVVIPVWNGRAHLPACLEALAASGRKPDEIVVVDDGSDDDSAATARAHGAKVLRLTSGPLGPATARNRGVEASSGDVIVFVDCDVAVHRETLGLIEQQFLADPKVCGVFGSYDDQPREADLVSLYRNLLHHYVHQQSRREASTFWAGCGAIRRETFKWENGFDETYRWASIEDIELGMRLTTAGHRLLLRRDILATHSKRWTLWEVIYTDIFRRAVPWTRLLLSENSLPNDLNLRLENRLSALAVWSLLFLLIASAMHHQLLPAILLPWAILLMCNFGLYRLFLHRGGVFFSLGAISLHWLHYLYSSTAFVVLTAASFAQLRRAPAPSPEIATPSRVSPVES